MFVSCKHFSRVRKINIIDLGDVLTGGQHVQHHGHDDENGGRVGVKGYDNGGLRPEAWQFRVWKAKTRRSPSSKAPSIYPDS